MHFKHTVLLQYTYAVLTIYIYTYRLKLYQTRIEIKCIQTSEIVNFSLSIFRFNTQQAQSEY